MNSVKKILVLGGPGSGKSVLSVNLGKQLNIPVYYLDSIHLQHSVLGHRKKERNDDILKILENDTWIMDGNYSGILKERIEECDIIIFLDYSTFKLVINVIQRSLKQYFKIEKSVLDNEKNMNCNVIKLAYNWRKDKRPRIVKIINDTDKTTYIFKSRRQLNSWFKQEFKEKIRSIRYE